MAEFESCSKCKFDGKSTHDFHCNECVHNAREHFRPKSNADRIRSMSDEELAEVFDNFIAPCTVCIYRKDMCVSNNYSCTNGVLQWLKSEVKE